MFLGGNNVGDVPANAHSVPLKQLPPDRRPQYVAYPPPDAPEVAKYTSKCCTQRAWARGDQNVVFIGQVPRLLPLQYIPWALDLLLEEYGTRWVLQTQPNGCAKAWVDDPAHCRTLIDRSKHMLFDVCGVWVARTRAQVEAMMAYQAGLQTGGPLDGRVPKHGMIAEGLRPPKSVTMLAARPPPQRPLQPGLLQKCGIQFAADDVVARIAELERKRRGETSVHEECDLELERLQQALADAAMNAELEQRRHFESAHGQPFDTDVCTGRPPSLPALAAPAKRSAVRRFLCRLRKALTFFS